MSNKLPIFLKDLARHLALRGCSCVTPSPYVQISPPRLCVWEPRRHLSYASMSLWLANGEDSVQGVQGSESLPRPGRASAEQSQTQMNP